MCGILAVFGCIDNSHAKHSCIIELSRRLRYRGPDWSGLHYHGDCYLAHQRLAIVGPTSGDQLLYNEDKTVVVTVNGEIYNRKKLREHLKLKNHEFRTGSDCEVIAHLYEEYGEDFVDMLKNHGENNNNNAVMARNNFSSDKVIALVCQNFTCSPPVSSPQSLSRSSSQRNPP